MRWHYAIPMILKQRRIILKQEDNRFVSCRMSTGLRIKWYVSVGQCTRPFVQQKNSILLYTIMTDIDQIKKQKKMPECRKDVGIGIAAVRFPVLGL